jgi:putative nucleotidyltransferase with HDIG domain
MADKAPTRITKAQAPKTRRSEVRRVAPPPSRAKGLRETLRRPAFGYGLIIAILFSLGSGAILASTRERPLVEPGRVMDETRTVRVEFTIVDEDDAQRRRDTARAGTPRVYVADKAAFDNVRSSLEGLPAALADAETLDQVAPEIREAFALTEESLQAVRAFAVEGEATNAWSTRVTELMSQLRIRPVLARDDYQLEQQEATRVIELRQDAAGPETQVFRSQAMNVEGQQLAARMRELIRRAGFPQPIDEMVGGWLVRTARPLYIFDESLTERARDAAAANVKAELRTYPAGTRIFERGERLSAEAHRLLTAEIRQFPKEASPWRVWTPRAGALLLTGLITAGLAMYVVLFCPRVIRNSARASILASLLALALGVSALVATRDPGLLILAATAPVVFVAGVVMLAYDQRMALAAAVVQAALTCLALRQGVGVMMVALLGAGVATWQLRELRQRNALVRAGGLTAVALAIGALARAIVERPLVWPAGMTLPPIGEEILVDTGFAALGGLLAVGVLTLILPSIEKMFGIMTGMTLIELRDPKQPLLRELQQRAPGTYNHSLTVATLAEAAADSIGANALEIYVGALYHDVGKMNKPDYFVENQSPGYNRHSKLSPAMSLLVIVGHVKDGLEFAREYNLPKPLHHYIESHHGTTLVEYFYRQAVAKAEQEDLDEAPAEVEYRYPGPKPRTKEAGILMLCDAVESATRAMADPTPSRIGQLVRSLASKRLADGQLDDCDLSLREVRIIEDAVIRTLCSVYHGRIAYPEQSKEQKAPATDSAPAQPATGGAPKSDDAERPAPAGRTA